ncbi:MAG TPA: MFS transporter [Bryobacteraceae bacterium]|nr:MFS transporter [Bryobacteraceae bacterium]
MHNSAKPTNVWTQVALISLGGFFEFYDIFFAGYIAPGLIRSGILPANGIAGFVAAMFSGLFVGTALVSFAADRFGRRTIFTYSLLWYTVASVIMAFQHDAFGLNLWRFISGIGVGVELVTIDTYLSELVPANLRGRAFAVNQAIQFCAVPVVALFAWLLVPRAPFGLDGWRWVVLLGAVGAILVWWIRRRIPESPRWIAQRTDAAPRRRGSFSEMWRPPYRTRSIMLIVFHLFQTVGFYGFSNWVPTLLIKRGIPITNSLRYTFIIAIAAPFGPLFAAAIADKLERKWQIVLSAFVVALAGLLFGQMSIAALLIFFGVLLTLANNILSFSCHAYQAELYPTRIRARAVGFVYSWSRISVVFSSFVIGFVLDRFGAGGVFTFIAGSMLIVMLDIGLLGPRTNNLALETISQ